MTCCPSQRDAKSVKYTCNLSQPPARMTYPAAVCF